MELHNISSRDGDQRLIPDGIGIMSGGEMKRMTIGQRTFTYLYIGSGFVLFSLCSEEGPNGPKHVNEFKENMYVKGIKS